MKPKVLLALLKETFGQWMEDKASRLGAALAYYAVFSIAPLLILVIGIAGLVFGEQAAQGEIVAQIQDAVGKPVALAIEDLLKNTGKAGGFSLAAIAGIAVLLFGATGLFVQLQDALNTIWKVTPKPGRPILSMLRDRLLSFTVVLCTAFLLLVSLVVSAALAALNKFMTPAALPGGTCLWQVVNSLVSFGFTTLLFAMIYKILPDIKIAWHHVWIGAAVTAGLFTAGKYFLGLYLGQSSTTSAFGAAGSLVVILLWVYYSSQIFLFGAEFTREYALRFGSQVLPAENAVSVTTEERARQAMPRTEDVEAKVRAGRPDKSDKMAGRQRE